jgi:protein-tyrosine-phosphatase
MTQAYPRPPSPSTSNTPSKPPPRPGARLRRHLRVRDARTFPLHLVRPVRRTGHGRELPAVAGGAVRRLRLQALAKVEGKTQDGKPTVLFLCVHNAGRSQMAMGFFQHLAGERALAWSGGSEPSSEVNPAAVAAMAERGIDISKEYPKPWTDEIVRAADVVISMGYGDACPIFPGKRYEEWTLDDPAGQAVEQVRPIRDEIERRIRRLLDELQVPAA